MGVMARLARDIPSSRYITRKKDNKDNRQKINMCKSEEKHEKEGLETVEEKLGRTTLWLHEVKQLEKDVYQMGRDESVILIRRRLGQSCAELQDIRDILGESVGTNLSHRQLAVLETETETADPSVQFFGVEWESLFERCLSLGLNISIFKQCLATDVVDHRLGLYTDGSKEGGEGAGGPLGGPTGWQTWVSWQTDRKAAAPAATGRSSPGAAGWSVFPRI